MIFPFPYFPFPICCLGVRDSTGVIQPSSTNSSRFEWRYNTDSCVNNYQDLILTEDNFSFHLIKNSNTVYNITEFSLDLPQRFDFYVPPEMQSNEYSLRIGLCDQTLTDEDIPITILTSKLDTLAFHNVYYNTYIFHDILLQKLFPCKIFPFKPLSLIDRKLHLYVF